MVKPTQPPAKPAPPHTSTRPYLIRALHDWCTDNGYTPYLSVFVTEAVQVPMEYVRNQEIVLNVSFDATSALSLGNDWISFNTRFAGVVREIMIPVDNVMGIHARENGQGMAFAIGDPAQLAASQSPAPPKAGAGLRLAAADGESAPAKPASEPVKPSHTSAPEAAAPPTPAPPGDGGKPPPSPGRPTLTRIK